MAQRPNQLFIELAYPVTMKVGSTRPDAVTCMVENIAARKFLYYVSEQNPLNKIIRPNNLLYELVGVDMPGSSHGTIRQPLIEKYAVGDEVGVLLIHAASYFGKYACADVSTISHQGGLDVLLAQMSQSAVRFRELLRNDAQIIAQDDLIIQRYRQVPFTR